MTRRVMALAVIVALVLTAATAFVARAQEEQAPPPGQAAPPAQAAPEQAAPQEQPAPEEQAAQAESVLLRLKFTPGETMRYRIFADAEGVMSADIPMPPEAQGMMPGQMPLRMVFQGEGLAKVLGVDEAGAARLRVIADNLSATMELFGQKMTMSVKGGKFSVTEGGKLPMLPGGAKIPFLQEPIEVKVGPRGEVLDFVIPGMDLAAMMPGMSMKDMLQEQILLPEDPLTVGQLWNDSRTITFPGSTTPMTYDTKMVVNRIENWAGDRKVANIRVEAMTSGHDIDFSQMVPPQAQQQGGPPVSGTMNIDQQLAGTMLFDATRGIVIRFDFQMNQQMNMASTVSSPDGARQSMSMTMNFTIKGAVAKI